MVGTTCAGFLQRHVQNYQVPFNIRNHLKNLSFETCSSLVPNLHLDRSSVVTNHASFRTHLSYGEDLAKG